MSVRIMRPIIRTACGQAGLSCRGCHLASAEFFYAAFVTVVLIHRRSYNWLQMSPTIFRSGRFRFYFFSREEPRMHVHVQSPDGEAKFWLEPVIALAQHTGLSRREISEAQQLVQEHENDIRSAWHRHFGG